MKRDIVMICLQNSNLNIHQKLKSLITVILK